MESSTSNHVDKSVPVSIPKMHVGGEPQPNSTSNHRYLSKHRFSFWASTCDLIYSHRSVYTVVYFIRQLQNLLEGMFKVLSPTIWAATPENMFPFNTDARGYSRLRSDKYSFVRC